MTPFRSVGYKANKVLDYRKGIKYYGGAVRSRYRMKKKVGQSKENVASMLMDCIAAGAYYWFRAEGADENMVSAMNRMKYRDMVQRFDSLNIPRPTPEEMYAYAVDKWPAHKLHPAPKAA